MAAGKMLKNSRTSCTDAAAEFALICAELWNKKMQESLAEAMSRGKVIGRVGQSKN